MTGSLSARLKHLLLDSGHRQAEIARRARIDPAYLSLMLSGARARPSEDVISRLAQEFKVNASWLMTGKGPREPAPGTVQSDGKEGYKIKSNVAILSVPLRWVPVISWAHAGAATDYEELPQHWQDEHVATLCTDKDAFALVIDGDSMEPRCVAGDRVVLMPNTEPRDGCLVVAKLKRDGVVLRRFTRLTAGKIRLIPYNTSYPSVDYTTSEFHWIYPVESTVRKEWS